MTEEQVLIDKIIQNALEEDIGTGDITTDAIIAGNLMGKALLETREDVVLAGLPVFMRTFTLIDPGILFEPFYEDGQDVSAGEVICAVSGSMSAILKAERTALNFVQRMSGIATLTKEYVLKASSKNVKILDTRKTAPGLRFLDKYSVPMGGGHNHRFGLYDGILIKDNHIAAAGSISNAVKAAKEKAPQGIKVEVEVESLEDVKEVMDAGADAVLLDNMTADEMKEAVGFVKGRVLVEASGGINLDNIREIAETGVDMISIGALTHSVRAVDLSLEVKQE
ncbi:carboxylating nicotinate-nucleotide diphosphorylase [Thermodesulfobacteriota bacterium]